MQPARSGRRQRCELPRVGADCHSACASVGSALGKATSTAERSMRRLSRVALVSAVVVAASALTVAPGSATKGGVHGAAAEDETAPGPPAAGGCDPLDSSLCMLPFPNNNFTVADPSSP